MNHCRPAAIHVRARCLTTGGVLALLLAAAGAWPLAAAPVAAGPDDHALDALIQQLTAPAATQDRAEAELMAGGWPAKVALRRYLLFPAEPVRTAARRVYQALGAGVLPDISPADLATLIADLREHPTDAERWQPLWQQRQTALLPLALCLWQERDNRQAVAAGLQGALEFLPPDVLAAWLRSLREPWRSDAIAMFDAVQAGDDWLVGNALLDLWLALGDDRRAYEAGRRLWLNWPRPGVLADVAAAVRHGGLGPTVWASAGSRLYHADDPATQQHELEFFLALAEAVGQPAVAPHLADVIAYPDAARLTTVDQLLKLKADGAALALLGTASDPVARLQRGWAQAHTDTSPLTDAEWAAATAGTLTQSDLARLGTWLDLRHHPRAADAWRLLQQTPPADSLLVAEADLYFSRQAEQHGDFAVAADQAEAALAVYDRHARLYADEHELRASIAAWRAAASSPELPYLVARRRATSAIARGDYDTAQREALAAVTAAPGHPEGHLLRFQAAKLADAETDFPAIADGIVAHLPADLPGKLEAAFALTTCGHADAAEPLAQAVIAANPNAPPGYLALAAVRQHQGRLADAMQLRVQVRRLGGDSPELNFALGQLQAMQGDFADAARAFSEQVRHQPDKIYGRLFLHWLRARQGQPDETAIARFRHRLGSDPQQWADHLLQFAAGELSAEALLLAARQADTPRQVRGHLCEAYFSLGQAALARHDRAAAHAAFTQAMAQGLPGFIEDAWARTELARLPAPVRN